MGKIIVAVFFLFLAPYYAAAQDFTLDVKEYRLSNGMKVLVCEKHDSPTMTLFMSFHVGSVNETDGNTGLSHFLEHMMFKGTPFVGTKDYEAEIPLMKQIDSAYVKIDAELAKPENIRDKPLVTDLEKSATDVEKQLKQFLVKDELWSLYLKNGGTGLNASTGQDSTQYYVSLPSNRLELWLALETDRIMHPVFREFYSERNVIQEERRMRVEDNPAGLLYERFNATAMTLHPYRHPVIGWMADIRQLSKKAMEDYFKIYYAPNNCTAIIVGDVDANETMKLVKQYFEKIPKGPETPPIKVIEPPQKGERRIQLLYDANTQIVIGYHTPELKHPDQPVLEIISMLLTDGASSRMHKKLVIDNKLCTSINTDESGRQFPNLFEISASPLARHTPEEVEAAIYEELELLKTSPVGDYELEKVRNKIRAGQIRSMETNGGIAWQIHYYETQASNWQFMHDHYQRKLAVTAADIQRVAKKYFTDGNKTVGILQKPENGPEPKENH
ncbi:MAG: insulinase family protein [Planctomycetes bacterium]|nr:insulinase family protein [Planctomycetota bacterium]